ncbi:hypothetical protein TCE0_044r16591 [Talaromyces pinophilus]|uniref:Uncharacterized protein n=1 Tax=Talaromyces pinophilus TaxID=128442 RepID=A0A478EB04_TALPI|nr:hypothetical protein TCE0_044r16591 [Talaromyces pinophilus]
MARVSRFIEHIDDIDYASFPALERSIALTDEKTALITSTESVAKPKTTTNLFARPFKAVWRFGTDCATNYKHHFCNLGQNVAHHDDKSIEGPSISSSSIGAPTTSAEELEQQSIRNNLCAVFGLRLDNGLSSFTASTAKKQPTTATTKTQATAEPRTPDAPTFWAQGFDKSEIERIDDEFKATIEYLKYLGVEFTENDTIEYLKAYGIEIDTEY